VADENAIHLSLTNDEALVLFDFLVRYAESDKLETVDQAEQRALWNLCAVLEKSLVEPLDPAYDDLVTAARERLWDQE
jgi:hypothetical protein